MNPTADRVMDERFTRQRGREQSERAARAEAAALRAERQRRMAGTNPNEEGEGEESVDTHPGDLVFTLRAKVHPLFRRKGDKDLEVFAGTVPAGDVVRQSS